MKTFRFKLDTIRTLRSIDEQRARTQLAESTKALAAAEQELELAQSQFADVGERLAMRQLSRFDPVEHVAGMAALDRAARLVAACAERRNESAQRRQSDYEEWTRRRQNVRVLDRLEEKEHQAHLEAARTEEQNALDEFAGMTATRTALRQ